MKLIIKGIKILSIAIYFVACVYYYKVSVYCAVMAVLFALFSDLLQTFFHEFGHFICGKLSGYHLLLFKIGPIVISNNVYSKKLNVRFEQTKYSQCVMIPDSDKYLLYNVMGIVFNLIITSVALVCCICISPKIFFFAVIFTGFNKLVSNCIPVSNGEDDDYKNDVSVISYVSASEEVRKSYTEYLRCYEKYYHDIPFTVAQSSSDNFYQRKLNELTAD